MRSTGLSAPAITGLDVGTFRKDDDMQDNDYYINVCSFPRDRIRRLMRVE